MKFDTFNWNNKTLLLYSLMSFVSVEEVEKIVDDE
jgi:hypothetical protein